MELVCELMYEGTQGGRGEGREGEEEGELGRVGQRRQCQWTAHTLLCASTNLTPFQDIERMISGNFFMFSVDVWNTQNTSVRACTLLAY